MSEQTHHKPELQTDTLELINTELADRLVRQAEAGAKIDTKAALLVGYVAAASSFLATRHAQPLLTGLALAAYAVAAGAGIGAYAVGKYQDVPDPRHLFNKYVHGSKSTALAALAARRVGAFENNAPKHRRKAVLWWWSVAALLIGAVLMFAALYVHTGSHGETARHGRRPAAATGGAATASAAGRPGKLDARRPSKPLRRPGA
jgi:hypothetical protein